MKETSSQQTGFPDWKNMPVIDWWGDFFRNFFNPVIIICNNFPQDGDIENTVLHEVGSYGFQLGRILDVLDLLVNELLPQEKRSELSEEDRYTLDQFNELYKRVTQVVVDHGRGSWRKKSRRPKMR
ncbi:MAG TPA: hypothetical protein VFB12_22805 [Ktedonobacteraceae bacterium]|nr:hypothetical protein [Ktedonobacteraceae bacterium]